MKLQIDLAMVQFQTNAVEALRDASGHQGRGRTLVRRRVFWPGMAKYVGSYVLCYLFKMLSCKGVETYSKAEYADHCSY